MLVRRCICSTEHCTPLLAVVDAALSRCCPRGLRHGFVKARYPDLTVVFLDLGHDCAKRRGVYPSLALT